MFNYFRGNTQGGKKDKQTQPPAGEAAQKVEQSPDSVQAQTPRPSVPVVPQQQQQLGIAGRVSIVAKRPSKDKLEKICLHPIDSRVAIADRGGKVIIWDYESHEVLYSNQFGGPDEGGMQELVLRKKAERYSEIINHAQESEGPWKAKNDAQYQMKAVSSGRITDVIFIDKHTCLWQQGNQESFGGNCFELCGGISELQRDEAPELSKHCWLAIATENKVSLQDLASSRSMDFPRSVYFESKNPTRLAVLVYNSLSLVRRRPENTSASSSHVLNTVAPVLAVGTNSGTIYLVLISTGEVIAKCAGAHSKAVTCLQVIGPVHPGGPDRLVSGSADGTIAVWDPSRSAKSFEKGTSVAIQPITCIKAHAEGVFDVDLFGLQVVGKNGALALTPYLASVGADKQMCAWNVNSWTKEHLPLQVLPKDCLVSVGSTMRAGLGLGSAMPLVGISDKSCAIFGLDPKESKFSVLIDLQHMLDKGDKKRPKFYSMALHPSKPSIIGLATNTGLVVLKDSGSISIPSSVSMLSQNLFAEYFLALNQINEPPAEEDAKTEEEEGEQEKKKEPIKIPQGILSINVLDQKLVCSLYKMESSKSVDTKDGSMYLENIGSLEISSLDFPIQEDTRIEVSPSGRYISIVWPKLNQYSVYGRQSLGNYRWDLIDSGNGSQLVWSSTAPIYAVLSSPQPVPPTLAPAVEEAPALPGFSMTYDDVPKEPEIPRENNIESPNGQEPNSESAPAPQPAEVHPVGKVTVHAIEESDAPRYIGSSDISLGEARPVKIHGGSLLGISACDPSSKLSLRFFSWVDFSPVGSNIPSPNWISWDPESTLCALGYETAVQLCAVYPHFHCYASLGIHDSESAFWQPRQLYISTPTSINVVFTDSREGYVEEICLADFNGQSKGTPNQKQGYAFGNRRLRPSGPVRLVGIKHGYLVLHDSLERPFLISLRNYSLRARSLAAKGDIDTAVSLTTKYVRPVLHDGTAQCLLAMGSSADYEKVLALPGLSPEMKISISIRHGDWNRAARAFQAFSLGVNDAVYSNLINEDLTLLSPSAVIKSPDTIGERNMAAVSNILEEAAAEDGMLDNQSDNSLEDSDSNEDSDATSSDDGDDDDSVEEEYVDPIDWNSWRNHDQNNDDPSSSREQESRKGDLSTPILDQAELRRILESVDLGLELSTVALNGHSESARQILGTLLAYSSSLSRDRLEKLVDLMVMANMTESLRNLWSVASSMPPSTQSTSVASLLSASVGGLCDANIVDSLRDAGLYPLAFLYAAVWGQGNPDVVESMWKDQLRP